MFQRILVPLDGSHRAERALPVAVRLAHATGGSVVLVRVVSMPVAYTTPFMPVPYSPALLEAQEAAAASYLEEIANSTVLSGVHTEYKVLDGSPALAILDAVPSLRTDMVLMTSHGRTGLARWMLGSVAQHVASHSTVPVIVLREHGPSWAEPHPDLEHLFRLLVPLDGSPRAEVALEPAVHLALALTSPFAAPRSALHLLLVLLPFEANDEQMPEALAKEGAKTYLARVAERLEAEHAGLLVTWTVTAQLDVASAILQVAENGDDTEGAGVFGGCDGIAMATHGYSGLKRWMLGSTTERVLQAAKLPILIVRPPEQPSAQ